MADHAGLDSEWVERLRLVPDSYRRVGATRAAAKACGMTTAESARERMRFVSVRPKTDRGAFRSNEFSPVIVRLISPATAGRWTFVQGDVTRGDS
jgi:hypothetical protein